MNSGITRPMRQPGSVDEGELRGELADLLRQVARGDRDALSAVYARTSRKLYGICMRLLGSEAEAQDVLQEVYVTIWRKAGAFDAARASPITWLGVLARNKAIDQLRRRREGEADLDEASDVADDRPSAIDLLESEQDRTRLANCLEELDEQPRTMIRSAFFDGASYPELADRAGVPLGTMKSWIRRGLLRLKGCLER